MRKDMVVSFKEYGWNTISPSADFVLSLINLGSTIFGVKIKSNDYNDYY